MNLNYRLTTALVFALAFWTVLELEIDLAQIIPAPAFAQVANETNEIFRERSEIFELSVAVSPKDPVVGGVHFSLQLLDLATMNPVKDARILVVVHNEENVPTYQTLVLNAPQSPNTYEGSLTFSRPALWNLRIEVDSQSLGSAIFRTPLMVKAGTPLRNPMAGFVLLGVIACIVGGSIYIWRSTKKTHNEEFSV